MGKHLVRLESGKTSSETGEWENISETGEWENI